LSDAHRRLLDKCARARTPPSPRPTRAVYLAEVDAIADLYQRAGALIDPTDLEVAQFIELEVIPCAAFGASRT
jgi:hypothetical protein